MQDSLCELPAERLANPFRYFGGKQALAHYIASILPEHTTYVEPFCGSAAVLFAKEPSPVEVINDLDGNVVNFFRCLQDPVLSAELRHRIHYTPYARREYYDAAARLLVPWDGAPDVRRAHAFFVYQNMAHGGLPFRAGRPVGWGKCVTTSGGGCARVVNGWLKRLSQIDAYIYRLRTVQVENRDAVEVIRAWDSQDTVFYCDPPYVLSTRVSGTYACEMTEEEHERLVDTLLTISGRAVVSGYSHPVYERLSEAGWERREFGTVCRARGCRTPKRRRGHSGTLDGRTEVLWAKGIQLPPLGQGARDGALLGDSDFTVGLTGNTLLRDPGSTPGRSTI